MIDYQGRHRRYHRYYRNLRILYQRPAVRDFTFLVLSFLTAAFFGLFAIKPSLRTIGGLIKEIKDKRLANQMLEEKIDALTIAQREYANLQADLPKVYAVLPQKNEVARLAKQVEYLARENNLLVLSFQVEKAGLFGEKESGNALPFEFDLNLGGESQDLKKFVEDIEKIDRLLTVETFSFSKKKPARREIEVPLSLRIRGQGYFLR